MRRKLVDEEWLVSHGGHSPMCLESFQEEHGQVLEGVLRAADGTWFPIQGGVPCLLRDDRRPDHSEFGARHGLALPTGLRSRPSQTTDSFSHKWRRGHDYGMLPAHQDFLQAWYRKKFGLSTDADLGAFYSDITMVLEVGSGSGFNSRFIAEHCAGDVIAVDLSEGAAATYRNTCDLANCHVLQADLMDLPLRDDTFDFVIADGVLHHTPDTRRAVEALLRKVKPGGRFFFYLYRKMGPARQFCDRHVRELFAQLDPEACFEACRAITDLGRELSRLRAKITLTRPIAALGIPAGDHDVQRLIYYGFLKCFWNDAFDFDTNNLVNFDWYHPEHAWQHTEEEVSTWLAELGVDEYRFNAANPNGISVLLTRPA